MKRIMKLLLNIFFLSLGLFMLISCKKNIKKKTIFAKENSKQTVQKTLDSLKTEEAIKREYWFLTNYFDGIAKDKTIAKYRSLPPVYFGIVLVIEGDSISGSGSISGFRNKHINQKSDTLLEIDSYVNWFLIKKNDILFLKERNIDPNTSTDRINYYYSKRPELEKIMIKNTNLNYSEIITNHFNKLLLAGTYKTKNDSLVHFKKNGEIVGLKGFKRYKVNNYFGTFHPFLEEDVVLMYDEEGKTTHYNWKIYNKKLVLTAFESPTKKQYMANRKKGMIGDYYVLGKKKIVLSKFDKSF